MERRDDSSVEHVEDYSDSEEEEDEEEEKEPGTHPLSIRRNLKRCSSLIESEDALERLEAQLKKQRLEVRAKRNEHTKIQTLTSLRLLGRASTWNDLDDDQKWDKEYILAILSCKCNFNSLPGGLKESQWTKYMWDPQQQNYERAKKENLVEIGTSFLHA